MPVTRRFLQHLLDRKSFAARRPNRFVALACGLAAASMTHAQTWKTEHDAAIASFRAGNARGALAALRPLQAANADSITLRADLIVVAQSAADDPLAVALGKAVVLNALPTYALPALARSARVLSDFSFSEAAYAEFLKRTPNDIDATVGRALALRGLGKLQEALDLVDALPRQTAPKLQRAILEVKALVSASFGKDLEVVRWSLEMLALDANDPAAQRYRFDALNRLGLVEQAREVTPTALLSREEQAQIAHDQLIAESRFVAVDERIQAYRFRIDPIIEALGALEIQFVDTKAAQRARWDRISLLLDRQRFAEAGALLKSERARGGQFPGWFTAVSAQTLLANREPNASVREFENAFTAGVNDPSARATFFYALLEAERTQEALAHVEKVQKAAASAGDKSEILRVQILQARALLYTDQVAAAWAQIEKLVALAPANVEVNVVKAEAQATRGWRREALETLDWIRGQYPGNVAATVQVADVTLQRGERMRARAWLNEARATDPENLRALRSARDRAVNDSALVRFDMSAGATRENQTVGNASNERRAELTVYSPWIADRVRVFGSAAQLRDERNAADVIERNVGALGVEWSSEDRSAALQLSGDNNNVFGVSARGSVEISDQLRVNASLGYDDSNLPLRAWRGAVNATNASIGGQWRTHESQAFGINLSGAHFSDGNNRSELGAFWTQRWLSQAHVRLDTRVDGYVAHNSKSDVAYFSPRQRTGAAANATLDWVQWRHYEKNLTHRLSLTAGFDAQRDVKTTGLFAARYEHAWTLGRCTGLRYGVEWLQRGYDGKTENKRGAFLSFEQRLGF
jgi:biofilm PGA synthesis protein PgaA